MLKFSRKQGQGRQRHFEASTTDPAIRLKATGWMAVCLFLLTVWPGFSWAQSNPSTFAAGQSNANGSFSLASPQIEQVWNSLLPQALTLHYKSFYLVDGRIYAMGSNGTVACIRADNGYLAWLKTMAVEGDVLRGPSSYRTDTIHQVAFTRMRDVVLVDLDSGAIDHTIQCANPTVERAVFSPDNAYVPLIAAELAAYRMKDGYANWRASFPSELTLPPVYVPSLDIVVGADITGQVRGLTNLHEYQDRVLFKLNLRSRPRGFTADGQTLYISTDNQLLHAIAMNEMELLNGESEELKEAERAKSEAKGPTKKHGQVIWQYRLANAPEGGPIVTSTAIYQATVNGGLHRIPKKSGTFKAWYAPKAQRFLAEWPTGVVVLTTDGQLGLIQDDPNQPKILANLGSFSAGISNPFNDAIFVTRADGEVRCLRPAGAASLKLASFIPPFEAPPKPKEEPRETFLERIRREASEREAKRNKTKAVEEIKIPPAPKPAAPTTAEPANKPATPAASTQPEDPLRSTIPVVK